MVGIAVVGRDDLAGIMPITPRCARPRKSSGVRVADMERVVRPLVEIFLDCGAGKSLSLPSL